MKTRSHHCQLLSFKSGDGIPTTLSSFTKIGSWLSVVHIKLTRAPYNSLKTLKHNPTQNNIITICASSWLLGKSNKPKKRGRRRRGLTWHRICRQGTTIQRDWKGFLLIQTEIFMFVFFWIDRSPMIRELQTRFFSVFWNLCVPENKRKLLFCKIRCKHLTFLRFDFVISRSF